MDKEKAEAEFGDVMFSLINAARLYKINPDNALERTNQKFINRFNYVEAHSIKEGKNLHDMTLEEMDKLWNEAKALEKESKQDDNKRRLLTPSWQPSLFVIHSLLIFSLAVFAGGHLPFYACLSAVHDGNAFQLFAPDKSFYKTISS